MYLSKNFFVPALFLILFLSNSLALGVSPYHSASKITPFAENLPIPPVPPDAPRWSPGNGELDEIMGDTIMVGNTFWESQHNGTTSRTIGYDPDEEVIHLVYADLVEEAGARHVKYVWIDISGDEWEVDQQDGYQVDAGLRAGYATLAMNSGDGIGFPSYHSQANVNAGTEAWIARELEFFPGVFAEEQIPAFGNIPHIWPHAAWGEYEGTQYIHVVTHESRVDNAAMMEILYSRNEYDADDNEIATEDQDEITDEGMNIAADVAVSNDGERVAIATTVSRGEENQHDNDIYFWISEDGGENWDWDEYTNLTDFEDDDTLRAYTDCNVYFDQNDILHIAFTLITNIDGAISNTSAIYHWDEISNVFTMVADGYFWNNALPGAWQKIAQRPSMYQDPDDGVLWLVYQQYGVPDDANDRSDEDEVTGFIYANGEVFVTASPPSLGFYGTLWAEGVNITNTAWDQDVGAPAGDCRSEREPNLALNNDGDYLNIFYVLDLDAGFVVQTEGEYTLNPIVYHRVAKEDLIDAYEENEVWLPNTPMHDDETMHWEDPYEYDWDDHNGSFFVDDLPPPEMNILSDIPVNFGEVIINSSDTSWVIIENTGEVMDLVIYTAQVGLEQFEVAEILNYPIAPGDTDSIMVAFFPPEIDTFIDTLFLTTNDPENELVIIEITGDGAPIPSVYDFTGELDVTSGEVSLNWNFDGLEVDDYIELQLYRNDEVYWTGDDTSYVDTLENVGEDSCSYYLSALYDEGESEFTDTLTFTWMELPEPFGMTGELDPASGEVSLAWSFDYMESENFLGFNLFRDENTLRAGHDLTYKDDVYELEADTFTYWVTAEYEVGESLGSDSVTVIWEGNAVPDNPFDGIPEEWALSAVYPNPFNPTLHIVVAVPEAAIVKAEIFDLLGRNVAVVSTGKLHPGYHNFSWTADGTSGVYFLAVSSETGWKKMQKIVYLK
ncbi:MAG: T9SS type A sorting domain-containing protein [Candidatus Electryonea clarkiae]|nr:T9SS type A sorting domain-containing protein [Candidatus Electryonea clarkiae]MDP8286876.1 T9SS type A sorting domain-containing protein [Candidatus Electryonea clarkiae]